ncbi:type I toxin-antitoxin system Fst family toxin [Enterococcus plantarum]
MSSSLSVRQRGGVDMIHSFLFPLTVAVASGILVALFDFWLNNRKK